jgi:HEPN domain-containing protein
MNPPNLKKRIYKKEYAQELLKIAAGDLDSSLELSQAKTGRPENIIFLVQQSVEKYIKAVLVHLQIGFPAVHDLGILKLLWLLLKKLLVGLRLTFPNSP